jgi:tRNA acetyltransferase TAN1
MFVKTSGPIVPTEIVHKICKDAQQGNQAKKYPNIRRLTPATLSGKANERNFEEVAKAVLEPVFHQSDSPCRKVNTWPFFSFFLLFFF